MVHKYKGKIQMKEPKTKTPKMGRPPKHEGERLSKSRTFRVRDALDNGLRIAAKRSGRSVSEEIESRLERSFGTDGLLDMALGENIADLIQMIFMAVARSGIRTGSKHSYEVLQAAIFYIIAAFARQLVPRPPRNEVEKYGARIAKEVLESFGFTSLLEHYKWMTGEHPDKEAPSIPRDDMSKLPQGLQILEGMRRRFSPETRALIDQIKKLREAEGNEIVPLIKAGDVDGAIEAMGLKPTEFRPDDKAALLEAFKAAAPAAEGTKKQ
jgi:hypothetical protein